MTDIVGAIFGTISETFNNFFGLLDTGIDNIVELFYAGPVGETPGGFTFLGTMLMIGLGIGLVWTLIKWVSGLVRNVAR